MESYWTLLAIVASTVGTGHCSAIDPSEADETDVFSNELTNIKSIQLLYKFYVENVMKTVAGLRERVEALEGSQSDSDADSASNESDEQPGLGAVYVRWGRTTCREGTQLVYAGYAGGSHYAHTGAAANYLCLTTEPSWSSFINGFQGGSSRIFGAEYEVNSYPKFGRLHDQDVPCAVCRAPRSSVMMVPGTNLCLDGWTLEYGGYLSAGHHDHPAATEFVCLDGDPKEIVGGQTNHNGKLFYLVEAVCGSLKCPKYEDAKELTCAVCSR